MPGVPDQRRRAPGRLPRDNVPRDNVPQDKAPQGTVAQDKVGAGGRVTRDDVLPPGARACFACGDDNPIGMHLEGIRRDGEQVRATLHPRPEYQGYPGVLHGGLTATALDEVMGYASILVAGIWAATATMELRYRAQIPLDVPLPLTAGVTEAAACVPGPSCTCPTAPSAPRPPVCSSACPRRWPAAPRICTGRSAPSDGNASSTGNTPWMTPGVQPVTRRRATCRRRRTR
jgi:Thioesterase superfamily